ncbi:MAG TPA: FlgD immunoglobulin-like domain containing protein [bacterium]|nr:FlgD immunoglobulin-like domain containing protein [bacterium]HPN45481.1 FlgD immunoglobulin-like domain containing protein [bacterium]
MHKAYRQVMLLLLSVALFFLAQPGRAVTADDIEFIATYTLDSSVEAYSPWAAVNPVDKSLHVFWCRGGNIYHKYRTFAGVWSSTEQIPDGGYNVYSLDDEPNETNPKPHRNISAEFDADGNIHFAFAEINYGLYYMKRTGTTWSTPTLAYLNTQHMCNISITKLNNRIFIAYEKGPVDRSYCVEGNGTGTSWGTPILMGDAGEFCYVTHSPAGYAYFWSRGYGLADNTARNVTFAYLSGTAAWTIVTGVSNIVAPYQGGAGPHMTVANGRIFMAWPLLTEFEDKERKACLLCASALEPGTSWTPIYPTNPDTLFFANTGDPFPRMATYSDGTPILITSRRSTDVNTTGARFVLWTGTEWTDEHDVPWENTYSDIACDGETAWMIHLELSTARPWWKGPIKITGLKNTALNQTPPDAPVLESATVVSTTQIKLSFPAVANATSYNVYRGTTANFTPDKTTGTNRIATHITDQDAGTAGVQWTDTASGAGNASTNHFYAVTAVGSSESNASNILGEFDYSLITTATTDFNEIAIPLVNSGIVKASDLQNTIPYCNSVAKWTASMQGYEQYVPGLAFTDFNVQTGYPYYVNVTAASVFTFTGAASNPQFTLITTATTSFNDLMLPLQKTAITTAAGLMADISHCNSVAKWSAGIQGYEQYIPGLEFTNFATQAGYPYYVNVTSGSTWPASALLKNTVLAEKSPAAAPTRGVPHVVYGNIPVNSQVTGFRAVLSGRSGEQLTETSTGCQIHGSVFVVQAGNFNQGWAVGDNMTIEFIDRTGAVIGTTQAVLTANAFDQVAAVNLTAATIPQEFALQQNYPNPFNPETMIQYSIPKQARVRLDVFNPTGQHIRTLVDEDKAAGAYQMVWNGRNDAGLNVSSGTYFYVLKCGDMEKRMKAVLVR